MPPTPDSSTAVVVALGLAAALTWGTADFAGGLATRRLDAFATVFLSQIVGGILAASIAVVTGERFPATSDILWAVAAGAIGATGLAAFYRGLATGRIGVVAPVAGVLAAAIPVAVGSVLEGAPGPLKLAGFGAGFAAVALVSTSSGEGRHGIDLAVVAGIGFGLFYVLIDRVTEGFVFWPLFWARLASVLLTLTIVTARRTSVRPSVQAARLVVIAGCLDLGGNALFVAASQLGRLDVASVLSSLYPVATVGLAALVLKERIRPIQAIGIGLAGLATVLIGAG